MTTREFVKTVNSLRKENKGQWYAWKGSVNGKRIALQGIGTWVRNLETTQEVDGKVYPVSTGSPMEMKVRDFNEWLEDVATR